MEDHSSKSQPEAQYWSRETMTNSEDEYSAFFHDTGYNRARLMHYHDYYEITFYLGSNSAVYRTNEAVYELHRGDIILCNMFEPHMFECDSNILYERFIIGIDPNMMFSCSTSNCNLFSIFHSNKKNYPILHASVWGFQKYMDLIIGFKNLDLKYGRELGEKAYIYQLLARVYDECRQHGFEEGRHSKKLEMSAQLVGYIETHLSQDITLDDLAGYTNYSVAHISRVFKEMTNDTLVGYINEKRLQKAKSLLRETMPIKEIADEVGFNTYSYFYKAFKRKTGMSPEDYRKLHISEKSPSEKAVK